MHKMVSRSRITAYSL